MKFGSHLPVAGGLVKAARLAGYWKMDCLQVFCGNPRGWRQRVFKEGEPEEFRRAVAEAGLDPVVVHAPYLINLASPDDELWQKSIAALSGQLERAGLLGAGAVVVHPGSRGEREADWGVRRVSLGVDRALGLSGSRVQVWLENTCGGGGHLGGSLEELAQMAEAFDGTQVGFCLDTAHALGAGYELSHGAGVRSFLDRVDKILGLSRVRLWHLNDSLHPKGSHRDQHTHLGRGHIGRAGFAALLGDPRLTASPGIMETPKESAWADRRNLAFARRFNYK